MRKWLLSNFMQQTVFIGPALVVYALIIALPFLMGIYFSFTDWNGVSGRAVWVGLGNFRTIFAEDPKFVQSLWFTARFAVLAVVLTNVAGFAIAYLLSKKLKSRNLLRTVFFAPNVLGGILLGFIWKFIFVQGIPSVGNWLDVPFFNWPWLGTENTSFWALVIVFLWHNAGYLMVIYIAGLTNVPGDLLEAATIDGAGHGRILRQIILPLLMPTITVCLFLTIAWAFKIFDLNLSLTEGGPFGSTESVAMNIYAEAFANNRYGLGSAKALIFFVIVAVVSVIQVSLTRKKEVDM